MTAVLQYGGRPYTSRESRLVIIGCIRQSGVHQIVVGTKVSDMQKNVTSGRRKGCPNYSPEFKQQVVAASCEPGISISKLTLENGINANMLFKWRQQWREGKLLLPSSESPQLLPVTLDANAVQAESLA